MASPPDAAQPSRDDGRALTELYRRHWRELCRYVASAFGAGPPDPEDVAQAAFAQYAALPAHSVGQPRAFLYRSARNFVIDHHRKNVVRVRFAKDALSNPETAVDDLHAERVLSSRQRLAIIETTIRNMEPRQRTVFIMNRIHELSFAEIARRTSIPESTVKRLVGVALIACERALRLAEGLAEDHDMQRISK